VKRSVPLESLKFGVCLQEKLPLSMYNGLPIIALIFVIYSTSVTLRFNFSTQLRNLTSFPDLGNKEKWWCLTGILSKKIAKNEILLYVVLALSDGGAVASWLVLSIPDQAEIVDTYPSKSLDNLIIVMLTVVPTFLMSYFQLYFQFRWGNDQCNSHCRRSKEEK